MKKLTALIGILAVLAAGCSSIAPPADIKSAPGLKKVMAPLAAKIAIGPLVYDVKDIGPGEEAGIITTPPATFYETLQAELRNINAFKQIVQLETAVATPYFKTSEYKLDEFINQAAAKGADMLAVFTLKEYRVKYHGTNGAYFGSIALWVTLWWPSWFIADETYSSDISVELKMYAVKRTEKREEPVDVHLFTSSKQFDFDDFQRGFQFMDMWKLGSLNDSTWNTVSTVAAPHSENDISLQLLTYARSQEFRTKMLANVTKEEGPSMALVVGINDYGDPNVPNLSCAEQDVRDVTNLIKKEGRFRADCIETLTGKDATADAVRSKLDKIFDPEFAGRPEVFIFFACHGTVAGDQPAFAFTGYKAADEKTAVTLKEIAEYFDKLPVKQLEFIADAGFVRKESARGLAEQAAADKIPNSALEQMTAAPGRAIFLAAGFADSAAEMKQKEHGLFTFLVLRGLQGNADANGDGKVNLKELFDSVGADVERQAKLLKVKQTPVLSGPGVTEGVFQINK
jgi:hypothetical protein